MCKPRLLDFFVAVVAALRAISERALRWWGWTLTRNPVTVATRLSLVMRLIFYGA